MEELFQSHIREVMARTEKAMSAHHIDNLFIYSGVEHSYYGDDNHVPFKSFGHFKHWCPARGPEHIVHFTPGKKPKLYFYAPNDFWHIVPEYQGFFWSDCFEVVPYTEKGSLFSEICRTPKAAFIGEKKSQDLDIAVNPTQLLAYLDTNRLVKTEYEQQCILQANQLASLGHKRAKQCFMEGASSLDIHCEYLKAIAHSEQDLPYASIIALDKAAAILHFKDYPTQQNGSVLLIDAGAQKNGYAADVTRTYLHPNAHQSGKQFSKEAAATFAALIAAVDRKQQDLCAQVIPGQSYVALHTEYLGYVGQLLVDTGMVTGLTGQEAVAEGIASAFFPHGLGHHIGAQVHDVGAKLANTSGEAIPQPSSSATLRNLRQIEEGHVLTVEPGFYFIPMLLNALRPDVKDKLNLKLIEALMPFGGIRIEDNVCAKQEGAYNLTREFNL